MESLENLAELPPPWLIDKVSDKLPFVLDIYSYWRRISGYLFSLEFWVDLLTILGYIFALPAVGWTGTDTVKDMLIYYEKAGRMLVSTCPMQTRRT